MKKFLAMALALLMVAVLLPVTAMAEVTALPAPGTTLPDAVGGVIKLTNNVNLADMAVVGAVDSNLTLDLNGFTITGSGTVLDVYGTLKIIDSSSAKTGKVVSTGNNAMWINNNTKVTMEAGTFEGEAYGIVVAGKYAEFTMNGGAATGKVGSGISGNGNETDGTPDFAPTTITINGGVVTGSDAGIYHPQVGTLNINGGSISGGSGIEMRAGTLNVTGGTITATATGSSVGVTANGGGPTTVGAAIAVSQHTTKHEITVNVNGGELTGVAAIYESNPQQNGEEFTAKIGVTVTGGTLNGAIHKESAATVKISGGTFTDTESIENYLADGKVIRNGKVVDNTIVIIVPDNDNATTTTTEKPANPSTGANDFVGVAAAAAVMALLGSAVVLRKK